MTNKFINDKSCPMNHRMQFARMFGMRKVKLENACAYIKVQMNPVNIILIITTNFLFFGIFPDIISPPLNQKKE